MVLERESGHNLRDTHTIGHRGLEEPIKEAEKDKAEVEGKPGAADGPKGHVSGERTLFRRN